jgi:hypothetical protein
VQRLRNIQSGTLASFHGKIGQVEKNKRSGVLPAGLRDRFEPNSAFTVNFKIEHKKYWNKRSMR